VVLYANNSVKYTSLCSQKGKEKYGDVNYDELPLYCSPNYPEEANFIFT
jgi:hypothetical protein